LSALLVLGFFILHFAPNKINIPKSKLFQANNYTFHKNLRKFPLNEKELILDMGNCGSDLQDATR